MKKYSDFKSNLNEAHHAQAAMAVPDYGMPKADLDVNLFAVENPNVRDRLNAAIAYITSRSTLDPDATLNEIRVRVLHKAGLDIVASRATVEEENVVVYPLEQFGGRLGMTPEEGFVNDDGVSHRLGGHKLCLSVTKSTGMGLSALTAVVEVKDDTTYEEEPVEMTESLDSEDVEFEVLDNIED